MIIIKIKDYPKESQPRERLLKYGPQVLSDAELLAVILEKGSKEINAIDMCNHLISKFGITRLSELSLLELQSIRGIGPAKAMQIISLFEFNKRHSKAVKMEGNEFVHSAKEVYNIFFDKLKNKKREHFYTLLLDSKNSVIKEELISIGTLNASLVHPREVFKPAIRNSANSIILVHNHPSGSKEFSDEDIKVTHKLIEAGKLLKIKVLDHIIITNKGFSSWKNNH